jgi:hypothetical protein
VLAANEQLPEQVRFVAPVHAIAAVAVVRAVGEAERLRRARAAAAMKPETLVMVYAYGSVHALRKSRFACSSPFT